MFQPEDRDWLNGYRSKTHIYAVYRRLTSDLRIQSEGIQKGMPCKWK